ncbi:MAG: chemotaxis protein CheW [Cyanobacteria bacterium P01_A01_bin.135]
MTMSALALPNKQPRAAGNAHLKFYLSEDVPAIFAMAHIQEVVMLPAQRLTPMPNMHPAMLGLMNRRSRVLWTVDLARLIGLPHMGLVNQNYSVIIIQVNHVALGLAVHHLQGMVWFKSDELQSPVGHVAAELIPYLRGCVLQDKEITMVLDVEALSQSPVFLA